MTPVGFGVEKLPRTIYTYATLSSNTNATILLGVACRRYVCAKYTLFLHFTLRPLAFASEYWSNFFHTNTIHCLLAWIEETDNHNYVAWKRLSSLKWNDITRSNACVIIAMISYVLCNGNNFPARGHRPMFLFVWKFITPYFHIMGDASTWAAEKFMSENEYFFFYFMRD